MESASHIVLRTPIAPLSGGNSVPLYLEVLPLVVIEVLACAVLRSLTGGAVEVVEHQVHVFSLLLLEVVLDGLVPVDLNLDVGISLSGEGSGLLEVVLLLVQLVLLFVPGLLLLLVLTYVKCLPPLTTDNSLSFIVAIFWLLTPVYFLLIVLVLILNLQVLLL